MNLVLLDEGIGLIALIFALVLTYIFKEKTLGLFDPLKLFLITRVSAMCSVMALQTYSFNFSVPILLFLISGILFIGALYYSSPRNNSLTLFKVHCNDDCLKFIIYLAYTIFFLKLAFLYFSTGSLPIFSEGGSNAAIEFDLNNKVANSFLMGLSNVDLILITFALPLTKERSARYRMYLIFTFCILIALTGGKKSSIFSALISISIAEYLRINFITNQSYFFISKKNMISGLSISFLWAGWIFSKTVGVDFSFPELSSIGSIYDFIVIQWAYPYILFCSGELSNFFPVYEVNRITYYFHSLLSPLGFPAFQYSPGPSIHEYLYGEVTGNGINPTFIIEGYILFGVFMPLYALLIGFFIGKARVFVFGIKKLEYKIFICGLALSQIYTIATDSLLFLKLLYIDIFVFLIIVVPLKSICVRKV